MKALRMVSILAVTFMLLSTASLAGPVVGDPAPDFCEPDTASVPHCLSAYQGNCILLTFWNSL